MSTALVIALILGGILLIMGWGRGVRRRYQDLRIRQFRHRQAWREYRSSRGRRFR